MGDRGRVPQRGADDQRGVVGEDPGVATLIATRLTAATTITSTDALLLPRKTEQLTWIGIDSATIQALAPFVAILPAATSISRVRANHSVSSSGRDSLSSRIISNVRPNSTRMPAR